jgi:hypothetical protein
MGVADYRLKESRIFTVSKEDIVEQDSVNPFSGFGSVLKLQVVHSSHIFGQYSRLCVHLLEEKKYVRLGHVLEVESAEERNIIRQRALDAISYGAVRI